MTKKSILMFHLFAALTIILAIPMRAAAQACVFTPALTTVTKTYSWANGMDAIVVTPTGFPSTAPLQTAMSNWQTTVGNWTICGIASFYFNPYPYQVITYLGHLDAAYASIPQPDPTKLIRGQTDLGDAATIVYPFPGQTPTARLATVGVTVNNVVTTSAAITEVFAHEIGHTFALNDCNKCGLNSTVMETGDSATANTLIGLPGPTNSDVHYFVVNVGQDYICPVGDDVYPPCQP